MERKVKVIGGFGEKKSNGGTQYYFQDRIYDINGLCPSLTTLPRGYWIYDKRERTMDKIKYFSIFSGIGGFEQGIKESNIPMECIGNSEVDKFADSIYRKHFPTHKNWGDATEIDTRELPNFDLLVGGFPCQPFSVAGKQQGFQDCRGTLFFEIARILKDCQPPYLLLENVKNLLSNNNGKTFQTILKVLNEVGYNVRWGTYNSKDFGVPQNRERVFIEGYFRASCGRQVLSFGRAVQKNNETVTKLKNKVQVSDTYFGVRQGRIHRNNELMNTLTSDGQNCGSKQLICQPVSSVNMKKKTQNGRRVKENGDPMFTLTVQDRHGFFDGNIIRKLTPIECERLQGFKDDYTKYGADGEIISDTQRYKCLGNAVTVPVVTYIINRMFGSLKQ